MMTNVGMFEEEKIRKQVKFLQAKCRKAGKRIKELEEIEKSHQTMNGKMVPTLMSMFPADEPNESTIVRWEEIQFDITIDDEFFSLRKMQQ